MQTLKQHLHDTLYGSSVYPVHTVQLTYWEKCKISYDIRAQSMLMGKVTAADALVAWLCFQKLASAVNTATQCTADFKQGVSIP